jgi:glycosyltransferase involved in cell wall biosynthesis
MIPNQIEKVTLSIGLATYNGEKYLAEQLDSFLCQTVQPDEVIICDDRSQDGTLMVIEEFIDKAPFRVEFQKNAENLGYAQNFSKVLSLCRGDFVFLSDQDDIWREDKIETMLILMQQSPEYQVGMHNARLVTADLVPLEVSKMDRIKRANGDLEDFVQGSCSVIRKQLLGVALPVPLFAPAHDNWIALITHFLESRLLTEKRLLKYRIHGQNTSTFHLNQPAGSKPRRVFGEKLRSPDSSSDFLKLQVDLIGEVHRRFQLIESDSRLFFNKRKEAVLASVLQKKRTLENRIRIRSKGIISRLINTFNMLIKNEYHAFHNGFPSMLRDILGR